MTGSALLWRALRRHRVRLLGGGVIMSGHQTTEALVPVAIGLVIDRAVVTGDATAMLLSVLGLAVLFTAMAACWRYGARLTSVAMERETHLLRMEVAERALDPRGLRNGMRSGEVLSVASSDTEHAVWVMRAATMIPACSTALVLAGGTLLSVHLWLGVGVLVGMPALVGVLQLLAPMLTRRSAAQQAANAQATALATDVLHGTRALRGLGMQGNAADRYRRSSEQALATTLRAATTTGIYQGVTTALSGFFLAAVAGFAGWLAIEGQISIGELVTVVGLAQFIAEPVRYLGACVQITAAARASADRLAGVLNAEPVITPGTAVAPPHPTERLRLEGVSHGSLRELDLVLAPGELLGLVCYVPRDAEALLALLTGRVGAAEYQGSVLLDGVAIQELDLDTARRILLVEPHDTALFEGTIRSTVEAGATGMTEAGLTRAILAAAAEDIVAGHPDGLDHPVTDRGSTLSGGQRQRLGLARALAAEPAVLVLHDPTTAVDAVTEGLIAQRMMGLRAEAGKRCGASTIVVTSSPALLERADRVLVVDDGRVTAAGRHSELSERDSHYREVVLR